VNRPTLYLSALGLALAATFGAGACSSPAVGDECSGTCPVKTSCETVCTCGNASCPTYACVTVTSTGDYELTDGGTAQSCSQL
jgi:hypothetical protein